MHSVTSRIEITEVKTKRTLCSTCGTAAVEFALIAPLVLFMWIGIVEFSEWHLTNRKVTTATYAAADLISQEIEITNSKIDDYIEAIKAIIGPSLVESDLGYHFASIIRDEDDNLVIDWQRSTNFASGGTIPEIAETLVSANDSVILVRINYAHRRRLGFPVPGIPDKIDTTETAFARPRTVPKIVLVD